MENGVKEGEGVRERFRKWIQRQRTKNMEEYRCSQPLSIDALLLVLENSRASHYNNVCKPTDALLLVPTTVDRRPSPCA